LKSGALGAPAIDIGADMFGSSRMDRGPELTGTTPPAPGSSNRGCVRVKHRSAESARGSAFRWSMRWVSVLSEAVRVDDAIEEVCAGVEAGMGGDAIDLVLVFASPLYLGGMGTLPGRLTKRLAPRALIGCSGGGVIGDSREVEQGSALAVMAASLPGVEVKTFTLRVGEGVTSGEAWAERLAVDPAADPCFLVLPDPFTCDTGMLLGSLDAAWPRAPKLGGLASGGDTPGRNTVFHQDRAASGGAVGVALFGDLEASAVVAQGCRPVGPVLTVTEARRNVIAALDETPALFRLNDLVQAMSQGDRALFRRGPMVGLAMQNTRRAPRHGDFLVRNLIGVDASRQSIAVGGVVAAGDQVQLHVRDAQSSTFDLDELLARHRREVPGAPSAALLFSCLGRGRGLFGEPDHDTSMLRRHLGGVPVGGFFCGGEIGPVHGRTWLHGYTSAIAVFRPRGWD
jgi:small ligand-binding sensory domain FIST